jgi:hypothetical protein
MSIFFFLWLPPRLSIGQRVKAYQSNVNRWAEDERIARLLGPARQIATLNEERKWPVVFAERPQAFYALIVLPSRRESVLRAVRIYFVFRFVQKESYMRKLRFIPLALTLIFACLLEGVQSFSSSRLDVRGAIASVSHAKGEGRGKVLAHVFIEGAKEPDTQVDKASVTVTVETEVFINRNGERESAEFAALKEGQRVEARFTGPVRLSYPVQADAAEITILEE